MTSILFILLYGDDCLFECAQSVYINVWMLCVKKVHYDVSPLLAWLNAASIGERMKNIKEVKWGFDSEWWRLMEITNEEVPNGSRKERKGDLIWIDKKNLFSSVSDPRMGIHSLQSGAIVR